MTADTGKCHPSAGSVNKDSPCVSPPVCGRATSGVEHERLSIPAAIEGELGLTAGFYWQPVEASAGFALQEGEKLTVEEVEATVPGLSISGDPRRIWSLCGYDRK